MVPRGCECAAKVKNQWGRPWGSFQWVQHQGHAWPCPKYSVQFSHSVVSDSLRPHELQHTRILCPSTPGACSNSCPLSWRWHPIISSSAFPFSSCLQSFPASVSFPVSQFFASGGQSIGVSASSVLPINIQDWFPLGWNGLITLLSEGLSRVFSNTTVQKHHYFGTQFSLWSNSHIHLTTGKTTALTIWTFVGNVTFLLFSMLSRFVVAFLPRRKYLLISWLHNHLQWFWSPRK